MRTIPGRLLGFLFLLPALFAQQDRIAGSIDSRSLVVLKGNSNPRARLESDRGTVDPARRLAGITLNFKPSPNQQAELQELLNQQQDRASAKYHHWLQPEEFADRFGLSSTDLAKVAAWAQSQGIAVEYQAHTRTWLRLSGSAAQVQSAFHVQLHSYEVNGEMHFANDRDPSIPAALEPLVSMIRGLDDFYPRPPHRIAQQSPDFDVTTTTHALVPADLWTIYDMNPVLTNYTGKGQKLVVVGQSNTTLTDVDLFRKEIGLAANDPQIVFAGGTDPGAEASQSDEIDLDLEWAGGLAPDATIYYVYAEDSFLATAYAIDNNIAPVISSSYTECEAQVSAAVPGTGAFFEGLAQQGNALGITWVVSAGDEGAAACDLPTASTAVNGLAVTMPASIPEVTGVGGATFNDSAGGYWSASNNSVNESSALKYIPEGAWNDTSIVGHLSASGGGASTLYQKPSWQTGLGVPNDGARDVPDVAFSASEQHVPYTVIEGGQVEFIGGTSASAPVFAGMLTILNQYLVANHSQATAGLGNINPTLYRLAHSSTNAFHDITSGSNIVPCAINTPNCTVGSLGYNAGPGYDEVTGLGSIDFANLASQWGAPVGAALTFTAAPAIMNQDAGGSSCPYTQYLTLQETNGFGVDLTSANYTSNILNLFGSIRIPPLGSLSAAVCYPTAESASSYTLLTNAIDTLGNSVIASTSVSFQTSAQNGGSLSISPAPPNPLRLNAAAASQPATGTITLTVGSSQQWTVNVAPSGTDSSWLSISPHAGTGPAQITVTASDAGLSAGVYSAILIFQSQNTAPQYVDEGVIFTIGASQSTKITAVANAASYQQSAAPGMYLSVFGTALAPPGTNLASSTSPIPLTLAGVSATINGIPTAVEYASPTQVNLLMPFEIPAGQAVLGLNNNGQVASYVFPVSLAAPGIFVDGSGLLAGAETAARGAEIAFYITGQGDVSPAIASNTAVAPPAPAPRPFQLLSVTIGGVPAAIDYAALAFYFEGLTQVNVTVPTSIAAGQQKVVVTVGGVASAAALLNVN